MKYLVASIICFSLALLTLLLMGCLDYKPLPVGSETKGPASYYVYCSQNPDAIICENLAASVRWEVKQQHKYLRSNKMDKSPYQSAVKEVEAGSGFTGNCVTYSVTVAELLIKRGADPKTVRLVIGDTIWGNPHMVVAWNHWIIDNRYRGIRYWKEAKYKWSKAMRLDDKVWRRL